MSAAIQSPLVSTDSLQETLHIYTRVSTLKQKEEGTSLETQLELGTKRAKELGFNLKHWEEGGASSHHEDLLNRPVLSELVEEIKASRVKHVWVYDASRLSRNDVVASLIRYHCEKNDVALYTKDGVYKLSNPTEMLQRQMLDAFAQHENATRMERTRLGKLNRVKVGKWHGGPATFGYEIKDGRLAINEEEAKWVREIFKAVIKKTSIAAIKQLLDSKGVQPRRRGLWSLGSINALISNTHYDGFYQYTDKKSNESIRVGCARVVDNLTWVTAQKTRAASAKRQLQKNATSKHFYLLRDFMYCAHCGRAISGRRTNQSVSLYYCPNREREWAKKGGTKTAWKRGQGCGFTRSMNIEQTDKMVWDFIKSIHKNSSRLKEDVKNRVLKQQGLVQTTAAQAKKLEGQMKRLQREHGKLSDTIGNLEANRLMKKVNDRAYSMTIKRLNEELQKVEQGITNAKLELKGTSEAHKWVDWLKEFGSGVDNLDGLGDQEKHAYLSGLIERIDVRCKDAEKEHELTVHLQMPIINDGIKYTGKVKNGWKEYKVVDGKSSASLQVKKKDHRGWA